LPWLLVLSDGGFPCLGGKHLLYCIDRESIQYNKRLPATEMKTPSTVSALMVKPNGPLVMVSVRLWL
jgi:hypothetical protein